MSYAESYGRKWNPFRGVCFDQDVLLAQPEGREYPVLSFQLTAANRRTRQAASTEIAVDIFESPSRRSVNTMGTSLIV